jgi:uncharacterized membrane protein
MSERSLGRVLIAGESWSMHTIHQKGFDSVTTTAYGEGHQWLSGALSSGGYDVQHLPNHLASDQFPTTLEELRRYDVVILSDIGANTLLLSSATFTRSVSAPNRLALVRDYVQNGGAFIMVGGYLTFQGIEGKARYAGTPVEEALPVTMMLVDDRVETPEGTVPRVADASHASVAGLPGEWPNLLGYNRIMAKPGATIVATVGNDPLIAVWEFGRGRSVAFASDCGPHWAPPEFVGWAGYAPLWRQLVGWAIGAR